MTPQQHNFLERAETAALESGHIFPAMAACEAAEESRFGESLLATADCNLLGMKQHRHMQFGTHNLPTKEFENGEWITVEQPFIHYPNWAACFSDRMSTLIRLQNVYPHYRNALHASDPETFIREVSATWSTDPDRAEHVLAIYRQFRAVSPVPTSAV